MTNSLPSGSPPTPWGRKIVYGRSMRASCAARPLAAVSSWHSNAPPLAIASAVAHSLRRLRSSRVPFDPLRVPGGFDGHPEGWTRKVEMNDPNPPPMANTLRSPAEDAKPAQAFVYDFETGFNEVKRADEQEAQEEEDALLESLMGAVGPDAT